MKEEEYNLCGQILLDNRIFHSLQVNEDHFLHVPKLFRAITKCIQSGITADIISVCDIDPTIDKAFVAGSTNIGSTVNWEWYQAKIIRAWKLFRLDKAGKEIINRIADKDSPDIIITELEKIILELMRNGENTVIKNIGKMGQEFVTELERRYRESPGQLRGLSSHIFDLDRLTNGFQSRRLIYIGARPSGGKSALMLNIACHLAMDKGESVGIISLESSEMELIERIFISEGGFPAEKIARASFNAADFGQLIAFGGEIYKRTLYVYDAPNINIAQLRSVCRAMVAMYGVKIIFIDYLQIIGGMNKRASKTERVEENSIILKEISRELGIPIVCLAQLNRGADDKSPGMGNFADSSQVEKDADIAILIHHTEKDSALHVVKNRDGQTGIVPIYFARDRVKIYSREREGS